MGNTIIIYSRIYFQQNINVWAQMFCFSKPHLLITSGSCTCFSASSHFKFLCLKSHQHHQKGALRRAADRVQWREILSEHSNKVQKGRKGDNGKGPSNVINAHVHLEHFKAFFPLGNSSSLFVFPPSGWGQWTSLYDGALKTCCL